MEKNGIVVEGFTFEDQEEAQKALREAESVQYIKGSLDMENPRMVLELYRKLTAEKVFETPVGLAYLKQLRDYLSSVPELKKSGLAPVQAGKSGKAKASVKNEKKQQPADSDADEMTAWYEEQLEQEKQKRRAAELKQRRTEERLKNRKGFLRLSIVANVFLLVVVAGMIVITLMDDHPNIINYENKIVDKYAEWEQELDEREQNIRKREQEFAP